MYIKDWKKDLFTIPNMLSLFRLLLIPVYIVIYLNAQDDADYYIAGGILAVSCLTDMVDGQIARHFNMISTIGKVLDPLADKATQFTLIICIAIKDPEVMALIFPLLVLFVVKEIFQLVAGYLTLRKGKMLSGALITGKISTAVLFVSLTALVMFPGMETGFVNGILILDGVLLLTAFVHYVITYVTHGSIIQKLDPSDKE